jgi:pyridoxal biosynthesis lyase PdxS
VADVVESGTVRVKRGLAEMPQGGVIIDVTDAERGTPVDAALGR